MKQLSIAIALSFAAISAAAAEPPQRVPFIQSLSNNTRSVSA